MAKQVQIFSEGKLEVRMLLEAYFLIRKTFSKNMVSGGESDLKTVHVTVLASSILVLKDRHSSS